MQAVHLEKGVVSVREIPQPERLSGFALLRLLVGGICNTDLELQRGYYGFAGTPGHEFVAEVVEADSKDLIGKRVTGEINLYCGECEWCRKGFGRHCPHRSVLGIVKHPGAFSEYFTLPERNLHVIAGGTPSERAVFAEPLAAACNILERATIPEGETIAVLGDGKLGLLCALLLNAHGYPVQLFGRRPEKMLLAARAGVATAPARDLRHAAFDWVVEATGQAEGLRDAVAITRPRGTIFLKSTVHGDTGFDAAAVVVNEIRLIGSRCGRFEDALPLLDRNLIPVDEMISARYTLTDAAAAFERAAQPGTLKVLLTA